MSSLGERAAARADALRERRPVVDHLVRAVQHYVERDGSSAAGAVTFFAFLSFFPILALAFFSVGMISAVYPEARNDLVEFLEQVLPGVVGDEEGRIPLSTFEERAAAVGWAGLAGVLYSGLGWVSGMRRSLQRMFRLPRTERPGFVRGKSWDLLSLVALGSVLMLSLSLSGAVAWSSEQLLEVVGLAGSWPAAAVLWLLGHGLAVAATTLLFLALFRMLARPRVTARALWQGALAGAVGFEVLKAAANFLIAQSQQRPSFQAFGVALILLVWINYFSRLVMFSAAWAYTAPVAEQVRELQERPLVGDDEWDDVVPAPAAVVGEDPTPTPSGEGPERRRRRVGLVTRLRGGDRG